MLYISHHTISSLTDHADALVDEAASPPLGVHWLQQQYCGQQHANEQPMIPPTTASTRITIKAIRPPDRPHPKQQEHTMSPASKALSSIQVIMKDSASLSVYFLPSRTFDAIVDAHASFIIPQLSTMHSFVAASTVVVVEVDFLSSVFLSSVFLSSSLSSVLSSVFL